MRKKIILLILSLFIFSSSAFAFSFNFFKPKLKTQDALVTAPLFNSQFSGSNIVWVGTFQLLWNDLCDNVVKGPIVFLNGQTKFAEELNKQEFNKDMLSESAYYTNHGFMTKEFKKTIETDLKNKFNDKSDILDSFNWNGSDFLAYAMLKKDFQFVQEFNELAEVPFGKNPVKVKYFGIDKNSPKDLRDNVRVMFYNSDRDFALKLYTKGFDKVILYRTDDNSSFDKIYADFLEKSKKYTGNKHFTSKDRFKVPFIEFKTKHEYKDLSGKAIKGTNFVIDRALQTVDFKMDNKGVKLKSEAAMIMLTTALRPQTDRPRDFYFDDTFVMFLIEKDKPYFALRVNDVEKLNRAR